MTSLSLLEPVQRVEELLVLGACFCQVWTRKVKEDMFFILHTVPGMFAEISQLVRDSAMLAEQFDIEVVTREPWAGEGAWEMVGDIVLR